MLITRRSRHTFGGVIFRDGPLPEHALLRVRSLCDSCAFQVDNLTHYMISGLVLHTDVSWIMSGKLTYTAGHVEDYFAGEAQLRP